MPTARAPCGVFSTTTTSDSEAPRSSTATSRAAGALRWSASHHLTRTTAPGRATGPITKGRPVQKVARSRTATATPRLDANVENGPGGSPKAAPECTMVAHARHEIRRTDVVGLDAADADTFWTDRCRQRRSSLASRRFSSTIQERSRAVSPLPLGRMRSSRSSPTSDSPSAPEPGASSRRPMSLLSCDWGKPPGLG